MTNSDSARAYIASHFINLFPNLIKAELSSDTKLLEELGLELATDATVSFGNKNIAFSRRALFKTIRSAFKNVEEEFFVDDISSKTWSLRNRLGEHSTFSLTNGNTQIINSSFWPLCEDIDIRLDMFEAEAKNRRLSKEELEHWKVVLSKEAVSDDDVSDLLLDFDCSPSHIEKLLKQEFKSPENNVSTLVPTNILYYERLVGEYCGSINIEEYCNDELKQFFDKRIENGMTENDLLLCMYKSISKVVSIDLIDEALYQPIAHRAIETCHPIFLISCLEIGVLKFADSSDKTIKALFECISSVKTLENLRLFCSMAIFVDGELARLQIFRGMPAFYRRLASFAQSALIVKVILDESIAFDKVEQWAAQQRGLYFFCQSFIDLIEEPRWLPTYLTAEQFINELYGRVNNACQEAGKGEVVEFLQKELMSGSRLNMNSFLPGPLEGNSIPAVVPDEIASLLAKHISSEASLESFRVLMNSTPFWKIDDKYLERTVSLLESAQHKLAEVNDKDSVYQVLNGLAQVSCMTRSRKLAASVTILSRLYRDYIDVDSEPENYLALGVVAGAAFDDKDGWAEFIGQWCTELAYLPISEDAIMRIEAMLERLCILEPYLYYTCSKALDIFKMLSRK
ncbi:MULTISPECIES: hypothetical protein [Dickeya]|uniref:hypothetical protein n=1 Tax=Dickeya TaxID=204037 RepID=UPI00039FA4D6|nr:MULTISPECIES: hypothetical protein [Dickeya]UGA51573.1 hypothetical protein QR68_02675 [Dickeya fangzhongdai]UWH07921.1 hypothetical protein K0H75_02670 [Dickeya fangzhongdai]